MNQANETYAYGKLVTDPAAIALLERIRRKHTVYVEDGSCPDTINEGCNHCWECECAKLRQRFLAGEYAQLDAKYAALEQKQEKHERKRNERNAAKRARRREKQKKVEEDANQARDVMLANVQALIDTFNSNESDKFYDICMSVNEGLRRMRKQMNYKRFGPY